MKEKLEMEKKRRLLDIFDILIEELDFRFLENCTDVKKVERILRILRSGEEGHYPDLEKFTETRLGQLNRDSSLLRSQKPTPVLNSAQMDKNDLDNLTNDLEDWLLGIGKESSDNNLTNTGDSTFLNHDHYDKDQIPIRGSEQRIEVSKPETKTKDEFLKPPNPARIKSCDYDKWSKYDVDVELTAIDVQELQAEEKKLRARAQNQSKKDLKISSTSNSTSKNYLPPSFIQEISQDQDQDQILMVRTQNQSKKDLKISSTSTNTSTGSTLTSTYLEPSFIQEIPQDQDQILMVKTQNQSKKHSKISSTTTNTSNSNYLPPSFIQEIPQDQDQEDQTIPQKSIKIKERRKIKIHIDDVHVDRL